MTASSVIETLCARPCPRWLPMNYSPVKIIHLSDIHIDSAPILGFDPVVRFEMALAHISQHHDDAERIVITGDLTHQGDAESYRRLSVILQNAGLMEHGGLSERLRLLIGNHDDRDEFRAAFPGVECDSSGFVQSAEDTPVGRFIYLDTQLPGTHSGHLTAPRLDWLNRTLAAARKDKADVYLFMHHNPAPVGVLNADAIGLVQWRELSELLSRFPGVVRHIFFGHCHYTLSGSIAGIPFSSPRSTNHPCWPNPGSDEQRVGYGPIEPNYSLCLIETSHIVVHSIDFAREDDILWAGSTLEDRSDEVTDSRVLEAGC